MKKLLSLLLALLMLLTLVGCGSSEKEETSDDSTLKVGVILVGDENEGYTYAHIKGVEEALVAVGLSEDSVTYKYKVSDADSSAKDAAIDLAEQGCNLIISNSYGHSQYLQEVAIDYPDITFVGDTGDTAAISGLANFKNAFTNVYEARYVSGVVAGMKIKELADNGELVAANYNEDGNVKVGYVGAFGYAEVISGMTAFLLGIRSVYPEVEMYVDYTQSWFDYTAEYEMANKLMSMGCVVIGQHADSEGAPTAVEENYKNNTYGFTAYSVGYNVSMLTCAPDVALTSATNNWEKFYEYAFKCMLNGEELVTDWHEGYNTGAVGITELGSACAPGTEEKVAEVEEAIKNDELHVFDVSTFTVNGETPTEILGDLDCDYTPETNALYDGYFHESELRSAPYFATIIDGVTDLSK